MLLKSSSHLYQFNNNSKLGFNTSNHPWKIAVPDAAAPVLIL